MSANKKKGNRTPVYTIRIDGLSDTFKEALEEDYDVGDRVLLAEQPGKVIYDENGEEVASETTFPRPVYGTVVARE
jgi:hypothetical protein